MQNKPGLAYASCNQDCNSLMLTGLSGAEGWLRVGTNILVLLKLAARVCDSELGTACSNLTRSSDSSSLICSARSDINFLMVGSNSLSLGDSCWNLRNISLTWWTLVCETVCEPKVKYVPSDVLPYLYRPMPYRHLHTSREQGKRQAPLRWSGEQAPR